MVLNKGILLPLLFFIFLVSCAGCISDKAPETQTEELSFTLVPDRTTVTVGEPFNIELVLTNMGDTSVNVWKLMEQISYDITFVDSNGSHVPYICGVIQRELLMDDSLVELKPGESLKINQDSSCWALPQGEYTLCAEYHTSDGEDITKPYWIGKIGSNNVSILIEDENTSSLSDPSSSSENGPVEDFSSSDVPVTIGVSSSIAYLSPDNLTKDSDIVLTGSVKEILPAKWSTSDGKEPLNPIEDLGPYVLIYRDVVVSVDEYLKNPLSSDEVTVRTQGGTIGNLTMDAEDEPFFEIGEKVLLYLVEDTYPVTKDLGPDHFVVYGCFQGKFSLTEEGKAVSKVETVELEEMLKLLNVSNCIQ